MLTDLATLERVIREIIDDYAKQNCIYLELRSTPKCFTDRFTSARTTIQDYIDCVIRVIKEGEDYHNSKIRVRYIASINRSAPVELATEMI